MVEVVLTVNGEALSGEAEPRTHLADFLRERLLLTGTHLGCEHGVCGACTLLIDGVPCRSCIAFAAASSGSDIRTVEGFDGDPLMEALREAFSAHHALQCGYCTSGMLITAYDIVRRLPHADERRIREELAGNLCRCTGYLGIVSAIASVLRSAPRAEVPEPAARPVSSASLSGLPRAAPAAGPGARASAPAPAGPTDAGVERRLELPIEPPVLWALVRDPAEMVRCLPGAEILEQSADGRLRLRLTAAIGPMRAVFEGPAEIHYDDEARAGELRGSGQDALSRTEVDGRIGFAVEEAADGARLVLAIEHALRGPLAQFSRGGVVEAIIDQLLDRFAANLAVRARGSAEIERDAPIAGSRLLLAALWSRVRGWFGG